MSDILNLDPGALGSIVLRTVVVYCALLLGLRLAGKRELGQMTSFDLVVVLIISNAVQNAMVGPDTSLSGGLVAAATLLVLNRAVSTLGLRLPWVSRRLGGSPTLLVHNGELIHEHLQSEGVSPDEVMQALREHGVSTLAEVQMAVLEVDGAISIVPVSAGVSRTRRRIRGHKPAG